ncbi:mucin-associated surface protein (MASP), putative, partial [Trypanosoma cruzi]
CFLIIFLHGVVRFLHFIGLIFLTKCVLLLLVFLLFLFFCASLHLFLLCVDVLLVCAEGCTQVTGVMATMMAGRVLLVCALCVLWCGAVFGHAMEDYCGEGGGDGLRQTSNGGGDGVPLKADCGLLSTRMTLTKAVDAADAEEMNVTTPLENLEDNKLGNNTQSTGATGPGRDVVAVPPPTKTPLNLGRSGAREQKGISRPVDANDGKRTSHTNNQN